MIEQKLKRWSIFEMKTCDTGSVKNSFVRSTLQELQWLKFNLVAIPSHSKVFPNEKIKVMSYLELEFFLSLKLF